MNRPLCRQQLIAHLLMGIRCGVKLIVTFSPAASDKPCSISGMCLWLLTPYALMPSAISTYRFASFALRPAPLTPGTHRQQHAAHIMGLSTHQNLRLAAADLSRKSRGSACTTYTCLLSTPACLDTPGTVPKHAGVDSRHMKYGRT